MLINCMQGCIQTYITFYLVHMNACAVHTKQCGIPPNSPVLSFSVSPPSCVSFCVSPGDGTGGGGGAGGVGEVPGGAVGSVVGGRGEGAEHAVVPAGHEQLVQG